MVVGCEALACVQQAAPGLLEASWRAYVVRHALGSPRPENKQTTIRRVDRHGTEIVTTEIGVFE